MAAAVALHLPVQAAAAATPDAAAEPAAESPATEEKKGFRLFRRHPKPADAAPPEPDKKEPEAKKPDKKQPEAKPAAVPAEDAPAEPKRGLFGRRRSPADAAAPDAPDNGKPDKKSDEAKPAAAPAEDQPSAAAEAPKPKRGFLGGLFRPHRKADDAPAAAEPDASASGPDNATAGAPPAEAPPKRGFFARLFGRKPAAPAGESEKDAARRTAAETAFLAECATLAETGNVVRGRDGWLFSAAELRTLARSGDTSTAVGAIAEYAAQLRGIGCDLIVVPVPPKALVHPDKVVRSTKLPGGRRRPPRLDSALAGALDALEARNVTTVDLLPVFLVHRGDKAGDPSTRTGQSWSPRGAQLAAEAVASAVKRSRASGIAGTVQGISAENSTTAFTGSLAAGLDPAPPAESLPCRTIGRIDGEKVRSVTFASSGGSLLVMGDQHVLAWRESGNPPGSTSVFASLADQLAAELQAIPDVLPGQTDGRNAPRLRILRDRTAGRGMLGRTKAVVWIFPALDLTSRDWQRVPLQLQFSLDQPELMLR